jgi:hypothetical protein
LERKQQQIFRFSFPDRGRRIGKGNRMGLDHRHHTTDNLIRYSIIPMLRIISCVINNRLRLITVSVAIKRILKQQFIVIIVYQ